MLSTGIRAMLRGGIATHSDAFRGRGALQGLLLTPFQEISRSGHEIPSYREKFGNFVTFKGKLNVAPHAPIVRVPKIAGRGRPSKTRNGSGSENPRPRSTWRAMQNNADAICPSPILTRGRFLFMRLAFGNLSANFFEIKFEVAPVSCRRTQGMPLSCSLLTLQLSEASHVGHGWFW